MSWYKMEREWMQNGFFKPTVFTEQMAWIWMIESAVWEDGFVQTGALTIYLKRGELSYSIRFMAEHFKWSVNRVFRFLDRLKHHKMVVLKTDTGTDTPMDSKTNTGQTVITICNYNIYQDKEKQTDTATDTALYRQTETPTDTNKKNLRTKEDKKKEDIKEKNLFGDIPPGLKPEAFFLPEWIDPLDWHEFAEMRKKIKKPLTDGAAKRIVTKLKKMKDNGHDTATILGNSITHCWQDVYEPKDDYADARRQSGQRNQPKASYVDKVKAAGKIALENLNRKMEADSHQPWNQGEDFRPVRRTAAITDRNHEDVSGDNDTDFVGEGD